MSAEKSTCLFLKRPIYRFDFLLLIILHSEQFLQAMDFHLNLSRLDQCGTNSYCPYGFLYCDMLDAYVQIGDFLTISQPTGDDIVGRLIDVSDLDKICVDEVSLEDENYFFLDNGSEEKKACGLLQIWKPAESEKCGFTPLSASDTYKLKGIGELVETRKGLWFGSFNVSNLAFLFRPNELTNGRLPALNGMRNLYFVRYQETFNQYGEINGSHFRSFSSTFGYAYRVFSCICHIRYEVDKMMFRVGMSQGNRAYIKTFLPADCWHYVRSFFTGNTTSVTFKQVRKRICAKVCTYDLTQQKVRLGTVLEIAEASTSASIRELGNLFGNSFGVGVRKRFPAVNLPGINIGTGDTVNIVSPTDFNKDKFSFRYNPVASKLNVAIYYSSLIFPHEFRNNNHYNSTNQISFIGLNNNNEDPSENNSEIVADILNLHLEVGNRLYRVANVTNDSVRVVPEDGSESSLHLPPTQANELVDEYNL